MHNTSSIAILGGGAMGNALATLANNIGISTHIWAHQAARRQWLQTEHPAITVHDSIAKTVQHASMIFIAVPIHALRDVARQFGDVAQGDHIVISPVRGVEKNFILPHQILREETCVRKIGILGGPLSLPDLATGRPILSILASRFDDVWQAVEKMVAHSIVKIHPSRDIIGIEIAGSIANVAAIAVGMAEALQLGSTATGLLLMRGALEARHIGMALGADSKTFTGLAGIADLIPRQVTTIHRHQNLGMLLATGKNTNEALHEISSHIDGIQTAYETLVLAQRLQLKLPLIEAVCSVLRGQYSAKKALDAVLLLDIDMDTR